MTPEGYAHLTHMLMSLAGGRVLLILEVSVVKVILVNSDGPNGTEVSVSRQGGYNLTSISDSMAMCTSVLLGDPPPSLAMPLHPPHHSAVATINEVIRHHAPYWRSLRTHSKYRVLSLCLYGSFAGSVCCDTTSCQFQSRCGRPFPPRSIVGNVVLKEKAGGPIRVTNHHHPLQDPRIPR